MSENHSGLVRDLAPFGLRIPVDLKDRIKRAASENNRSISAEIIFALEQTYPAPAPASEIQKKLDRVIAKWESASSDEDRAELVDHLTQIRRQIAAVVEETTRARVAEEIARERERNKPVTEADIPF